MTDIPGGLLEAGILVTGGGQGAEVVVMLWALKVHIYKNTLSWLSEKITQHLHNSTYDRTSADVFISPAFHMFWGHCNPTGRHCTVPPPPLWLNQPHHFTFKNTNVLLFR